MSAKKAAVKGANHGAIASTRATIQQICVGLLKCYEMAPGQKVSIEELGDVTLEEIEQIEVKVYKDKLTDGHPNFWKTLKNWVDDTYDAEPYSYLVLYTTQSFADGARLEKWNKANVDERLEVLKAIQTEFRERFEEAKAEDEKKKPSDVYKLQEYVFASSREVKLKSVVEKYVIETGCPDMPNLAQQIMDKRIVGVPEALKVSYLEALLGFVFSPLNHADKRWEITREAFHARNVELMNRYCKEARRFPKKVLRDVKLLTDDELDTPEDALFIQKIQEIDLNARDIVEAKSAHFGALRAIEDMYSKYQVSRDCVADFVEDVLGRFEPMHKVASLRSQDVVLDSQVFYHERHADAPPSLGQFDDVSQRFRNGVLHMEMDEPFRDLQWKLKPNE
jgi:hypothetical protein